MKPNRIFAATLFIALAATAFKMVDDIINRIGITHSTAQNHIMNNLLGDFEQRPVDVSIVEDGSGNPANVYNQLKSFKLPYLRQQMPKLIAGDKAGMAKELCAYVKEYVSSQEFADKYAKIKEQTKPTSEPYRMDAAQMAQSKKDLKEMENNLAKMKAQKMQAQYIKQMEDGIANFKKTIAENQDPTPNKTKWEYMYPEDPAVLVKRRLQEYLTLSATVDFNAPLAEADKYGRKKFIKPEHESKSLKWKAIYRAGKEVNDVVTAFVKEWLKGEIIAKEKGTMANYKDTKSPGSSSGNSNNATPASNTEPAVEKAKEKKSLFKKLKEKIGQ